MEERRLLLAVALSFLVITAYQVLLAPPPPRGPRPTPRLSPAAAETPPPAPPAFTPPPAPVVVPSVADERERRVEVLGPDLAVAFTNRGARMVSWRLTRFRDARGHAEEMVQTVPGGPRPLDVETGDPAVDSQLREALFRSSAETVSLSPAGETALRFDYAQGELEAVKVLRFRPTGYLVAVSVSVRRAGRELPRKLLWGPGIGNPTAGEMEVRGYQEPQAVYLSSAGVERVPAPPSGADRRLSEVTWVGVESHYFAALWVPPGARGTAEIRGVALPAGEDGKPRLGPQAALDLGTAEAPALLYVGPKDPQGLAALGHEMAQVVPVGEWIGGIVVDLIRLVRWVHGHVGNYGWSIVVVTVFINLALGPFRHYSIANGIKMAKLAPEMRVIQDRYRGIPVMDKRREQMQREMTDLYSRHGMSMGTQMAVGCLPILLTMPFLIAFYRVLDVSIELRGASFLWIPDLSQKDPLFLTPVLMGASMFVMQKMTPTAMDPAQQRMMMFMPLMLVAFMFAAPAGLNLYWLASNVCAILQQGITLRIVASGGHAEHARKGRRGR